MEVAREQVENTPRKLVELRQMKEIAEDAFEVLSGDLNSFDRIGHLLHDSWMIKRTLSSKVTTKAVDELYRVGREAGALGGKLCGAGGGGFLLFFVPPEARTALKLALRPLVIVPVRFSAVGVQVIFDSGSDGGECLGY